MSDFPTLLNRRAFLGTSGNGFGAVALASMMARADPGARPLHPASVLAPKARHVIYLFQSGGPSHVDLFDGKPSLEKNHGKDLPPEVRGGQRVTGMTAGQKSFPVVKPIRPGRPCGPAGAWISNLLPWTQKIADRICV
ncbi:MAG: DUF1501 domain-containing protein, partial [Akkermansiaceae bacterium]|nr:DUF1501 domain-containing protein [Akkermansiaceae bacterium]